MSLEDIPEFQIKGPKNLAMEWNFSENPDYHGKFNREIVEPIVNRFVQYKMSGKEINYD